MSARSLVALRRSPTSPDFSDDVVERNEMVQALHSLPKQSTGERHRYSLSSFQGFGICSSYMSPNFIVRSPPWILGTRNCCSRTPDALQTTAIGSMPFAPTVTGPADASDGTHRYDPRMSNARFAGMVVAVTGAAGGIGRSVALRFAAEGAAVVAVDLPGGPLDDIVTEIVAAGGRAISVAADVTIEAQVAAYVAAAVDTFGGLDALINNAGIEGKVMPLTQTDVADFDRVLAVNVRGVWLGMKHAAPAIAARGGGAIVNTASVAGLGGTPNIVAYGASKHAVIGMTKTAAIEFAPQQIRVNAVCPSPVETRMMRSLEAGLQPTDPTAVHDMIAASIPLGRYGEPSDVAALMCFLCSADAAFLSGAAIPIDGAMKAR